MLIRLIILLLVGVLSCSAASYYVDYDSGSDANNGTSTATPWKHIPADTNAVGIADSTVLQSGDVVSFKGGVIYAAQRPYLNLTRPGVTYRTEPSWGTGKAIISGLPITNSYGFKLSADGNTIDNLEIRNFWQGAVWIDSDNATVTNCLLHTFGPQPWDADPQITQGNGVYSVGTSNTVIAYCTITNCNNNGIYLTFSDEIAIIGNDIGYVNIDVVGYAAGGYMLIAGNRLHDAPNATTHGDGIQLLGQGLTSPAIVCNNIVWGCTQDIFVGPFSTPFGSQSGGEFYVFNNVVYNPIPGPTGLEGYANGIVTSNGRLSRGVYVFNNTLIDMNAGSGGVRLLHRENCYITNFWNVNNLFYNSYASDVTPTNLVENLLTGHNLYTNFWRPGTGSFEAMQAFWPGWETNSVIGPVTFYNASTHNYTPIAGPAIGGGTNLSALVSSANFSMIPAAFRPDPTKDRNGVSRGATWDIGAYEFTTPPPVTTLGSISAVTNLRIQ